MDEATLKSIELDLQDKYGHWPSRADLQAIIDALRYERERAARAEAELKQLREDAGRFVAESAATNAKLQDVREAAEAFANDDFFERDLDDKTIICVASGITEAVDKLRAALTAVSK